MRIKTIEDAVSPVIGVMLMLVVTVVIAAVVSGLAGDIGLDKKTTAPCLTLSEPVLDYDSYTTEEGSILDRVIAINYYTTDDGGDTRYNRWLTTPNDQVYIPVEVYDQHGLTFTHLGGDAIDLKDLQMGFNSQNLGLIVDWGSTRAQLSTGGTFEQSLLMGDVCDEGYGHVTNMRITYWCNGTEIVYSDDPDAFDAALQVMKDLVENTQYKYFVKINPETPDDTIIRTGDQFKVYTDDGPTGWAIAAYDSDGQYRSFGFERGTGCEWRLSHKPSGAMLASGDITWPDTN